MTRQEFKKIVVLAVNKDFKPLPLGAPEMDQIAGCALDNKRRFVTREVVATMICNHCATFAGTWDFAELDELEGYSKRFDLVD